MVTLMPRFLTERIKTALIPDYILLMLVRRIERQLHQQEKAEGKATEKFKMSVEEGDTDKVKAEFKRLLTVEEAGSEPIFKDEKRITMLVYRVMSRLSEEETGLRKLIAQKQKELGTAKDRESVERELAEAQAGLKEIEDLFKQTKVMVDVWFEKAQRIQKEGKIIISADKDVLAHEATHISRLLRRSLRKEKRDVSAVHKHRHVASAAGRLASDFGTLTKQMDVTFEDLLHMEFMREDDERKAHEAIIAELEAQRFPAKDLAEMRGMLNTHLEKVGENYRALVAVLNSLYKWFNRN